MKNRTTLLVGLALTVLLCGISVGKAHALPSTILRVEAPAEVSTGATFTATVTVENVEGFFGWEFIINWTAGKINCTGETLNYGIWGTNNYLGPWVAVPIDNVAGEYYQSLTGRAPGIAANGTFQLVTLTFEVISGPSNITDINFKAAPGTTYGLVDYNAEEIPHQFVKATVHAIPELATFLMLPILVGLSTSSLIIAKKIKKRN